MNEFLSGKKKILTMIFGVISGLSIVFGLDQSEIGTIAGAVVMLGSVISYIIAEGRIDVARITRALGVLIEDEIEIDESEEE